MKKILLKHLLAFLMMRKRKHKMLWFVCSLLLYFLYYLYGIGDYLRSRSFQRFDYPLNVDIRPVVKELLSGKKPALKPINYYPHRFLTNSGKCNTVERLDLFIAVKSAMANFGHRSAIRQTYGQENVIPGRIIKTLFFLGIDDFHKSDTQRIIDEEIARHKDIIQIDFHDNYYNNTIKTMMSFKWLYEHCSTADYYLFTDDDMYISVSNLLDYVHERATSIKQKKKTLNKEIGSKDSMVADDDVDLYAGFVYYGTSPTRFKLNKWWVSVEEYPWDLLPPFAPAGAYVLSNKSMKTMYVASMFVKHFRFDDVYLGIVAKKVGIELTNCSQIYNFLLPYSYDGYKDVIASHGYDDHDELIRVWNEQYIVTLA